MVARVVEDDRVAHGGRRRGGTGTHRQQHVDHAQRIPRVLQERQDDGEHGQRVRPPLFGDVQQGAHDLAVVTVPLVVLPHLLQQCGQQEVRVLAQRREDFVYLRPTRIAATQLRPNCSR
ncbi:hypothetical protein [Streptomyces griseofuscus]|uniref:hypothetical protein n=1 Tax=Streptomyces griseofuscus TaxID=146922 RepID=UPI00380C3106